ncbi:MAG: CYTH domain-containing protein [Clostridiales bacterium]|nr:CYTH domain-containing protein [Clostridiales bacterium]
MKNIEQELKLSLDEREYRILYEQANVKPQLQTNYYFGYPSMSKEVMVRIRQKGSVFVLCYKRRMSQIDGVTVCDEHEIELAPTVAQKMLRNGINSDQLKQLFGVVLDDMRCLGSMDTYRTKFTLNEWVLELDKNVYFDQVDYELECEHNDVVALNKLKNYLYYKFGVVIKPAIPKVQRFLLAHM